MSCWNHIILEGYCMFEVYSKKKHTLYELKDIEKLKFGKKKVEINKAYIPPKERPSWCIKQNKKRIPQFRCMFLSKKGRCPFLKCFFLEKKTDWFADSFFSPSVNSSSWSSPSFKNDV